MGVEALVLGAAAASVAGGVMGYEESKKQAKNAERDAMENAKLRKEEVSKQISSNVTMWAKSGVSLEGSPLFQLERDAETGAADVRAIIQQGKVKADSIKAQGRQALLGGLAGGAKTVAAGM